jgi:hypothetical protein
MFTLDIGGHLLAAVTIGAFTVLLIEWWKYRYLGRR